MTKLITVDPEALRAAVASAVAAGVSQVLQTLTPVAPAEGTCNLCDKAVSLHVKGGRFVGCPTTQHQPDIAALLTESKRQQRGEKVREVANDVVAMRERRRGAGQHRAFKTARYVSTVHHRTKVKNLGLTPRQTKIVTAVQRAGKVGLLAKEIRKRTGLSHGSVESALHWLRQEHGDSKPLIVAVDANAEAPKAKAA